MSYLGSLLGKEIECYCDQGRVIHINGRYLVFGDKSVESSMEIIKETLDSQLVFFEESSEKNLNPVVHKVVNVLIHDPLCDYNPIERSL
jgi:hypothetical protein